MRTRLFVALICMLTLPMFASTTRSTARQSFTATVAFAGHHAVGPDGDQVWCACGSSEDCICDPNERSKNGSRTNQGGPSSNPTSGSGLGEITLLGALLFALLLRLSLR